MPGLTDEAAVLGVGDRLRAQIEVVDVDAMDGPFVFFGVLRSHEEFASRAQREFGKRIAGHQVAKRIAHQGFRLHFHP